jgi:hypothetical protein
MRRHENPHSSTSGFTERPDRDNIYFFGCDHEGQLQGKWMFVHNAKPVLTLAFSSPTYAAPFTAKEILFSHQMETVFSVL